MKGKLPKRAEKIIKEWTEETKKTLIENWDKAVNLNETLYLLNINFNLFSYNKLKQKA